MFEFIDDIITGANSLVEGVLPSKSTIKQLVRSGITLYAISDATGVAVEVLEKMLKDDSDESS